VNEARTQSASPGYGEFARTLYRTGILSDPWLGGRERFRLQGLVLEQFTAQRLKRIAERVAYLHHELAGIVWNRPELVDDFFHLTPYQKAMWLASGGRWHGIARIDLFICSDGNIRACEMNSDTPSGEAEAVVLNNLLHQFHPDTIDPNLGLEDRFWKMLVESHRAVQPGETPPTTAPPSSIAIIYPTDLPEDLSMIALYRTWLERRGCRVVLGSPYNITVNDVGSIRVLGEPIDLIVRHYKTDWWGERETIWAGQPSYPDPEPLDAQLLPLLKAECEGKVTVVNPFGAVLTQNKMSLALMWEYRELFSSRSQQWISKYIPETRRVIGCDMDMLDRTQWVLKSTYGCEGDSVICGPFVKPREWRTALKMIEARHWVAQRFFEVSPTDDGLLPNYGVYVVGGRSAGFYARLSTTSTDYSAVTTPVYLQR